MKTIKTILHPTDFSANSAEALGVACALAKDKHARLVLLHVVPCALDEVQVEGLAWKRSLVEHVEEDHQAYRNEMRQKLDQLRLPAPYIPCERILTEGEVATVIVRTAEQTGSDLIVMGTHGQRVLTGTLMGSVAEQVSRKASCPVVTISCPRCCATVVHESLAEACSLTH